MASETCLPVKAFVSRADTELWGSCCAAGVERKLRKVLTGSPDSITIEDLVEELQAADTTHQVWAKSTWESLCHWASTEIAEVEKEYLAARRVKPARETPDDAIGEPIANS